MQPRSLQRAWKMKPWMPRLSGLTLKPSTQSRGVDAWISSLQDIRASHSPSPEPSEQKKIRDTSGRISEILSSALHPRSVSLKTSHTIYDWGLNKSMMTYDQWVTGLRRVCLQRKKSVRHINESAFSSWPTVRVSSANGPSQTEIRQGNPKKRLENSAVMWPTVTATDACVNKARSPEKMIRKDGRNVLRTPSLAETVMQPSDFPYTKQDLQAQQAGKDYKTARVQWPTPRAQEPGSTSASHGTGLAETAKAWSTPVARDWKDSPGMKERRTGQVSLSKMAFTSGHQDQETMSAGDASPMRLNPLFTSMADGMAYRVDRLRACGNGVVPLVAAYAFFVLGGHRVL